MAERPENYQAFDRHRVLVLASPQLTTIGIAGLCTTPTKVSALWALLREHAAFHPHAFAEATQDLKQAGLHILVRVDGQFLIVQRGGKDQNAPGLEHRYTFGLQGHIEQGDVEADTAIEAAVIRAIWRKVGDELDLKGHLLLEPPLRFIGIINDNSDLISSKHFGFVYLLDLPFAATPHLNRTLISGRYTSLDSVAQYESRFDNWSRIIYQQLARWVQ